MRMDKSAPLSAHDVVNGYDTAALTRIIRDYGEERFASRISNAIGAARADKPIETTTELAEIIKMQYRRRQGATGRIRQGERFRQFELRSTVSLRDLNKRCAMQSAF